ncbi:MAG: DUF2190 family protein [Pseudomonadota bacterium]
MAANCYKGDSDTANVTLAAAASSGGVVVSGTRIAIVKTDGLITEIVPAFVRGVFSLTKLAGEGDIAVGAPVHWDTAASRITITPSATTVFAGVIALAVLSATTTAVVDINVKGMPTLVAAGADPVTAANFNAILAALKLGGWMATV